MLQDGDLRRVASQSSFRDELAVARERSRRPRRARGRERGSYGFPHRVLWLLFEYCRGRLGVVRARASVARVTRLVLALSSAMGAFTARYKPRRLSVAKQ